MAFVNGAVWALVTSNFAIDFFGFSIFLLSCFYLFSSFEVKSEGSRKPSQGQDREIKKAKNLDFLGFSATSNYCYIPLNIFKYRAKENTRNRVYQRWYRGFESHRFRPKSLNSQGFKPLFSLLISFANCHFLAYLQTIVQTPSRSSARR